MIKINVRKHTEFHGWEPVLTYRVFITGKDGRPRYQRKFASETRLEQCVQFLKDFYTALEVPFEVCQ